MRKSALLVVAIAASLSGCNWFKNFGKKDNVEPPTPLTEIVPTATVERVWSEGIGDGAGVSGARLVPTIVGDRVYAASVDGTVEALDAATGRTLWQRHVGGKHGMLWRRTDNSVRWGGGPAVDGDLLVVGGLDGQLYGLSAADGSDRWNVQLSSEVVTTPAIAQGVVVVRTNDGRLFGLDATDGSRKWLFEQSVPALSLRGNSAPLIVNGVAYGGYDNGRVVAIRIDDGSELWLQALSVGEGRTEVERLSDVDGNIVSDGRLLFAGGYRGQLMALTLESGRPAWQRDLSTYTGVAIGDNAVVAVDAEGNVWAFDRETGVNLWKQDQLKYRWLSAPAVQGRYVVVGDSEGYVHWLGLDDGKFAARERLGKKPIEGAPQVAGDLVYVEDIKGHIAAYRAH